MSKYCCICFESFISYCWIPNCLSSNCTIALCDNCDNTLFEQFNSEYLYISECPMFRYCSLKCVYEDNNLDIEDVLKGKDCKWLSSEGIYNHQAKLLNDIHTSTIKLLLGQWIIRDLCDIVLDY